MPIIIFYEQFVSDRMIQKICIMFLFTVVSVIADTDELENPGNSYMLDKLECYIFEYHCLKLIHIYFLQCQRRMPKRLNWPTKGKILAQNRLNGKPPVTVLNGSRTATSLATTLNTNTSEVGVPTVSVAISARIPADVTPSAGWTDGVT